MSSFINSYVQTNNSDDITNLPSFVQSCPNGIVEIQHKMIEVKKQRLKALMALAKSQTLLTEIDIAIAQYELKLEMNKLRQPMMRRKDKTSLCKKRRTAASRGMEATEKYETPRTTLTFTGVENTDKEQILQPQNVIEKDTSSKPRSEVYNMGLKNLKKTESVRCSVPLSKIMEFQNASAVTKSIITMHLSQQNGSNAANALLGPQYNSDQDTDISINIPKQDNRLSTITNSPNDGCQPKPHFCINMLRVIQPYNISIIPNCTEH